MRRWPILPTMVVALAVLAMLGLGAWQLDRRNEKAAALARYAANVDRPPIAFPRTGSGDETLFRRSSVTCLRVVAWRRESGRNVTGAPGWRVIADCATRHGTVPVQLGVARAPDATPAWRGGAVAGYISHAPDHRPLVAGLFDRSPRRLMLVATTPPAGLQANRGPDLSTVPNNHLAYAVQWFLFAAIALIIYVLALRRRTGRRAVAGKSPLS